MEYTDTEYTDKQVAKIVDGVLREPYTPSKDTQPLTLSNDAWVRIMQEKTGIKNLGWGVPVEDSRDQRAESLRWLEEHGTGEAL